MVWTVKKFFNISYLNQRTDGIVLGDSVEYCLQQRLLPIIRPAAMLYALLSELEKFWF